MQLTDSFWLPRIQDVQEKTIAYALEKCREEGRMDNFLIAGGKMEGDVKGVMPFDDSDLYKIIEGASTSLISAPNSTLEQLLDSLVAIIKTGQETDGYLTTWRTINPAKPPATWVKVDEGKRWEYLNMSHELYNAGHLYEAAAQHFKATGKTNFLTIALDNANLMVQTFGEDPNKLQEVPGHQIIETGLIKLYRITANEEYLKLAKYFLDHRGDADHHELYGSYSQDHLPVVAQEEVVGHAVRAVYMYAAMTDIAALQKDNAYLKAVHALWNNMVSKKMYITGGIGAKHEGEAFGANYELPNSTAYNETCAAIGSVYWNQRLFNLTGNTQYVDVIERTLYNGLLSGLSLDGTKFFYPNALESDGVYKFNQGACTRKGWFDCSCCPTNLIRFLPSVPQLIYAKQAKDLYVNLYADNKASITMNNQKIKLVQQTQMPWQGRVRLTLETDKAVSFRMKLRIPYWARNEVLSSDLYALANPVNKSLIVTINGQEHSPNSSENYLIIDRTWASGDVLELTFPMEVRSLKAHPLVKDDEGKVALERGPFVYAFEAIDNNKSIDDLKINPQGPFQVQEEETLLNGVYTLSTGDYKAIPYYSWSNRGVGKMKVWGEEKQ